MPVDYKIVSADDHLDIWAIPPKIFEERLSSKWKARAPKVVKTPQGDLWQADGETMGQSGFIPNPPHPNAIQRAGLPEGPMRPSTPRLRLQDMDADGIYASVIYGPVTGIRIKDPELTGACWIAYNDFAAEFNAASPDRLCLLAYLPMQTPEAAAAEVRRVAKLGHKGVVASFFHTQRSIIDPAWEPLWQAAEETGIALNVHLGGGCHSIKATPGEWTVAAFAAVSPMQLDEVLVSIVFSGVLERHPKLKFILGESGLGWIPYVLNRLDMEFVKYATIVRNWALKTPPRQIFKRQIYATFQEDEVGIKLLSDIGADNVMWASDYPHVDSTFPHSRKAVDEMLHKLDPVTVRKLTRETAAKVYSLGQK